MAFNDQAWHVGFKWTIGDEDNPTGAICLDDSSDALHICEIKDARTDWNVSTTSHPTLYLHSASDPATDFISMYHDGTSGIITLDGTTIFTLTASTLDISVATTIAGDLDITTDDIAVSQGYYMYFDGLGNATEYIRSDTADYLEIVATTGIDLKIGTTDEVAITASAVTLASNNLVLSAGNITLAVGQYLYLDGSTGNYLRCSTDDNVILNGGTTVKLGIAGTAEVSVTGAALYPETDNGQTLGILNTNEWSDLFLASEGVIGWNNNNMTITHSAGTLTVAGGMFKVEVDSSIAFYAKQVATSAGCYGFYAYEAITSDDATGGVWGVYGDVTWTHAGSGGKATLMGTTGRVTINGTFDAGVGFCYAVSGELHLNNAADIDGSSSVFAALNGVLTDDASPSLTSGHFACCYLNNLASNSDFKGVGNSSMLYIGNNAGLQGFDQVIYLYGKHITNFITFSNCTAGDACVDTEAVSAETSSGRIKILVDGSTRYLYYWD